MAKSKAKSPKKEESRLYSEEEVKQFLEQQYTSLKQNNSNEEEEKKVKFFENALEFNEFVVSPEKSKTHKLIGDIASKDIVLSFSDKALLSKQMSTGEMSVMCEDFGLEDAKNMFNKLIHLRALLARAYNGFERKEVNTDRQQLDYKEQNANNEAWYKKIGKFKTG